SAVSCQHLSQPHSTRTPTHTLRHGDRSDGRCKSACAYNLRPDDDVPRVHAEAETSGMLECGVVDGSSASDAPAQLFAFPWVYLITAAAWRGMSPPPPAASIIASSSGRAARMFSSLSTISTITGRSSDRRRSFAVWMRLRAP